MMKKVSMKKKEKLIQTLKEYDFSTDKKDKIEDITVHLLKANPQSCKDILDNLEFNELGQNMIRYILCYAECDSGLEITPKWHALFPGMAEIKEMTRCLVYDCIFEIIERDLNKQNKFDNAELGLLHSKKMKQFDNRYNHDDDIEDLFKEYKKNFMEIKLYDLYKDNNLQNLWDILLLTLKIYDDYKENDESYTRKAMGEGGLAEFLGYSEICNEKKSKKKKVEDFCLESYDLLLLLKDSPFPLTRLYLINFFRKAERESDDLVKKFFPSSFKKYTKVNPIELDAKEMLKKLKKVLSEEIKILVKENFDSIYKCDKTLIPEKYTTLNVGGKYVFTPKGLEKATELGRTVGVIKREKRKNMIVCLLLAELDEYEIISQRFLIKIVKEWEDACEASLGNQGEVIRNIYSTLTGLIYNLAYVKANTSRKLQIEKKICDTIRVQNLTMEESMEYFNN